MTDATAAIRCFKQTYWASLGVAILLLGLAIFELVLRGDSAAAYGTAASIVAVIAYCMHWAGDLAIKALQASA